MTHSSREIKQRRTERHTKRQYIQERKAKPCTDCGVQYPYWVMQFDHVDPSTKLYLPSDLERRSWATIDRELEKCEVVCANCHMHRTYTLKHHLLPGCNATDAWDDLQLGLFN